MNPVQNIFDAVDSAVAKAFQNGPNNSHCCSKGCYHCCKEPAYASESEMRYALELLTPEQREEVTEATKAWLEAFLKSEFINDQEPSAFKYRLLCLFCPLLNKDGTCRVYDRRPLACRLHYAHGSPEGCKDDEKRHQQKFALFPGLMEKITWKRLDGLKDGDSEDHDHIGLLLAKILLGSEKHSMSRVLFQAVNDTLVIHKYEDDEKT